MLLLIIIHLLPRNIFPKLFLWAILLLTTPFYAIHFNVMLINNKLPHDHPYYPVQL